MRRSITCALALLFLLIANAPATMASAPPGREVRINAERFDLLPYEDKQRVLAIKGRLEEIIAVDPSALDRDERLQLRSEWKALKKEMKMYNRNGSVIYISTAALIIIILLLIILL